MAGVIQVPGLVRPQLFGARQRLLSGDDTVGGGDGGGDPDNGGSTSNTGVHKKFQRFYAGYAQRAYPIGAIPPNALEKGYGQTLLAPIAPLRWVSVGPGPFRRHPGDPGEEPRSINSGRVDALLVDPLDAAHWLIGTSGGVCATHDGGVSWTPRTDDQPSLAISALAYAPSAPSIIYAGTGNYDNAGSFYPGVGVLKSIDGGATWARLGAADLGRLAFSAIAVDPSVAARAVAATVDPIVYGHSEAHLPPGNPIPGVWV